MKPELCFCKDSLLYIILRYLLPPESIKLKTFSDIRNKARGLRVDVFVAGTPSLGRITVVKTGWVEGRIGHPLRREWRIGKSGLFIGTGRLVGASMGIGNHLAGLLMSSGGPWLGRDSRVERLG
ncbi:hypothetical protein V6N11_067666 [Hibiscus sabdariffa]|uniref:Uncharacterized protein n=1 Tax=Hibiscus sabdariffa TaxID=183260 RepID=A0ABR2SSC4_9ROSI